MIGIGEERDMRGSDGGVGGYKWCTRGCYPSTTCVPPSFHARDTISVQPGLYSTGPNTCMGWEGGEGRLGGGGGGEEEEPQHISGNWPSSDRHR